VSHTKVREQVEIYQHIRGATNVVVIADVARESLGCVSLWPQSMPKTFEVNIYEF
jgi:hypothetical protein